MSKQKNEKRSLKKPLVSAVLGVSMLAGSVAMLTGCSGEKGDKGDSGSAGKSAYEIAVENGFEGTVQEWLDSLKGSSGSTPTITIDPTTKHWLINGQDTGIVAEGQNGAPGAPGAAGSKGETGNGIADVDVRYEFDEMKNLWSIFTITFTDGSTQEAKAIVPSEVENITMQAYYLVNQEGYNLSYYVNYKNGTSETYPLSPEDILTAPDFTQAGETEIVFNTILGERNLTIHVLESPNDSDYQLSSVFVSGHDLKVGSSMDDVLATYSYNSLTDGEPIHFVAPFDANAIIAIEDEYGTPVQSIDFTKPGYYNIEYDSDGQLGQSSGYFSINLYNPSVSNVKYIMTSGLVPDTAYVGDTEFIDSIIGSKVIVNYFEPVNGKMSEVIKISEEMLDTSVFNINSVGAQIIGLSYGGYTNFLDVNVIVDLTDVELTATLTASDPGVAYMYGETIKVYENGYGVCVSEDEDPVYFEYDKTEYAAGFLKMPDATMGGDAYLKVTLTQGNSATGTFSMYIPSGEPAKHYQVTRDMMGMQVVVTLHVYGTEGECWTVVYPDVLGGAPYSTTKVTYKDENTLTFAGEDYVIGEDILDVTPQA